jgi:hypothetical protein
VTDRYLFALEVEKVDTLVVTNGHHPPLRSAVLCTRFALAGGCHGGEAGAVDAAVVGERGQAGVVGCFEQL